MAGHPLFFVTGKPNKKKEAHRQKKVSEMWVFMVGVHGKFLGDDGSGGVET